MSQSSIPASDANLASSNDNSPTNPTPRHYPDEFTRFIAHFKSIPPGFQVSRNFRDSLIRVIDSWGTTPDELLQLIDRTKKIRYPRGFRLSFATSSYLLGCILDADWEVEEVDEPVVEADPNGPPTRVDRAFYMPTSPDSEDEEVVGDKSTFTSMENQAPYSGEAVSYPSGNSGHTIDMPALDPPRTIQVMGRDIVFQQRADETTEQAIERVVREYWAQEPQAILDDARAELWKKWRILIVDPKDVQNWATKTPVEETAASTVQPVASSEEETDDSEKSEQEDLETGTVAGSTTDAVSSPSPPGAPSKAPSRRPNTRAQNRLSKKNRPALFTKKSLHDLQKEARKSDWTYKANRPITIDPKHDDKPPSPLVARLLDNSKAMACERRARFYGNAQAAKVAVGHAAMSAARDTSESCLYVGKASVPDFGSMWAFTHAGEEKSKLFITYPASLVVEDETSDKIDVAKDVDGKAPLGDEQSKNQDGQPEKQVDQPKNQDGQPEKQNDQTKKEDGRTEKQHDQIEKQDRTVKDVIDHSSPLLAADQAEKQDDKPAMAKLSQDSGYVTGSQEFLVCSDADDEAEEKPVVASPAVMEKRKILTANRHSQRRSRRAASLSPRASPSPSVLGSASISASSVIGKRDRKGASISSEREAKCGKAT